MSYDWKPFSSKQLDVIDGFDSFINILEGSVRSGKTIAANVAWLYFVLTNPYDQFLMSGESTDSLYRNVVKDLVKIVGDRRATYQKSPKGGPQLIFHSGAGDKVCYCRGADKVTSEEAIRGMTIAGWYADEVTLHHETFIKQAINRMSLPGAKAIWTTNPDNPNHFIKKEYIDRAGAKGYCHWHFSLEDNLTLDERYKVRTETGVFGYVVSQIHSRSVGHCRGDHLRYVLGGETRGGKPSGLSESKVRRL